jgi:hypothetical protein
MKSIFRIAAVMSMMFPLMASAQKKADPQGHLTYSLPATVIMLEVEAVQENFYAGPYAKYAEKYLGIKARQKDESEIHLTEVRMVPLVEADQRRRYSINLENNKAEAEFLKLSSQGLVSFADTKYGETPQWRFPMGSEGDFSERGISSNLTSESATLYYNGGAVKQSMLVGKTTEQKAAESAEMILKLREQRLQIVTGDTDATYSGEAMGAAIAELTRLEQEHMMLFTGYSESQTQKMRFEVLPSADQENQMYIAFRLSDTDGLVPADKVTGKPVIMQIIPQEFMVPEASVVNEKGKKKNVPEVLAYYRIPAVCTVKLMDGAELLLQSRMPIYQLGQETSLPVNVIMK